MTRFSNIPKATGVAFDWRGSLRELLIAAGTAGIKQRDITHRLMHFAVAEELTAELDLLLAERKVQRFKLETKGRPAVVWRATTLILEE